MEGVFSVASRSNLWSNASGASDRIDDLVQSLEATRDEAKRFADALEEN